MPTLTGDKAIEHLKQQGSYQSLQEAISAVQYEAKWQPMPLLAGVGTAQELSNRANDLLAYVTAEGLEVTSLAGEEKSWRLGLKLTGLGYGANLSAVSLGAVSATGSRVEIKRNNGLTEWFVNSTRGIEQGFTLATRPTTDHQLPTADLLRLRLAVSGDLQTQINGSGEGAAFQRQADNVLLSYDKLFVSDAKGRRLAATMKAAAGELVIEVADGGAEYPLTIDPLLRQLTQLTASDGAANDLFGWSVAVSGDTVVIGATTDDVGANTDQGSAYVFIRSGVTWSQQAQLTAADGELGDQFGISVAISGDTVVVGAIFHDVIALIANELVVNPDQGSAYIFIRSGVTWSQQAQLTAADGAASDNFGFSVSISGDTVVVGAIVDDNRGSAYVFIRSGTTWSQQQKVTASDGAVGDLFGISVALSGDTIVVGARDDDVGANFDQGSAYVFVRSGTSWSQQQKLTAADGTEFANFGISVSISGDTIVVGAYQDDVSANPNQGSAYVFVRSGTSWSQQQKLTAADGTANDFFGWSVAVSGDTIVVGAYLDDVAFIDQGSAYVFIRSGVTWAQQQKLTVTGGSAGDQFGYSVALSGNTIVVGAILGGDTPDVGTAYIYFMGCNTAPSMAAVSGVTRQQGSPATVAAIATVFDSEDPIGYLTVTVATAPAGISVTSITNNNGNISASISAGCAAAPGMNIVILRVSDSDGAVGSVQLLVNVTANSLPTLGVYNDTPVAVTGSTTVTPNAPPADNGSIAQFGLSAPSFAGNLGFNPANGAVTVTNARPGGNHVVTITATDNCGAIFSSAFILTVNCLTITVNPASIPAGTAGSAYNQVFTQTGGNGAITFSLSGGLPTGLSFTGATLSGTPTQVGSFPVTVTATDQNNCSGSRSYTLIINAPLLVWTGSTSSDWHTASNWTPNAIPTSFHDVSFPSTGVLNEPVIANASSSINAMTLQAGRVLTIASSRQLATAGNITSGGQITGAGSLLFDGATFTQNGSVSVASVEFDAGTHALTGGGSFASGIITVLGGASVALTSNHSVSVVVINNGGSFNITNRTLMLTGAGTAIFNSGSVNATGSTVIYQGTVSQVVTANIAYNNLSVNNPAGVSLAGDTTVNGLLDLQTDLTTGTFTLTMPASGSSSGEGDVIGKIKRTGFVSGGAALSFGNPMNRIRIDSGAAPADITVELVNLPPFGFSNTVTRTYTITANGGSGIEATLRLRYRDADASGLDETAFELWRQAEAGWQTPAGAATRDTSQNWVEESGISEFSMWTISGGAGPICGVLSPISQFFEARASEGRVIVTALTNCSWTAGANVSWIEVMSSQSGAGTEVVSYVVRDNLTAMPRLGTMTIAGQAFTVVQAGQGVSECGFSISPAFTTYGASGGAGSVSITTEQQCAWEAVSDSSWITITSTNCGIGNGTITYSVGANPGPTGRAGKIRIGGKVFAIKQKGP